MARSILDRANKLSAQADTIAGLEPAAVSPVHGVLVDVMGALLELGNSYSGESVPSHLRVMMRVLNGSRPMLIETLANVPPDAIQGFVRDLIERLQTVVDAPTS